MSLSRPFIKDKKDNVIFVDFPRPMSLDQAKEFLGDHFFNEAMHVWPISELKATIDHPECCLFGANEAYEAVLRHRAGTGFVTGNGAQVIKFLTRLKTAA